MISRRNRTKLILVLAASLVCAAIGFAYTRTFDQSVYGGALVGFFLGFFVLSFEWFVLQGRAAHELRQSSVAFFLFITITSWSVIILICLRAGHYLFATAPIELISFTTGRGFVVAFLTLMGINLFLRTNYLVGSRVLGNFFLGRYNTPVQEDLIFMFLDLEGSTAISERLGPFRTHTLIKRFFYDVSEHVVEFGGVTHRYVGDEVVVTWRARQGLANANWLRCVFSIRSAIDRVRESYLHEFGVVPAFRVGLHCGKVVAGEVGEDKREIVYIGDVVNTTARLEQLCRDKGTWLLVSRDLLMQTNVPPEYETKSLGPVSLRGRSQALEVFTVRDA